MKFFPTVDLLTETKTVYESVRDNGEVVITSDGKPSVLMLHISEDDFEETLQAFRQAKMMMEFQRMRNAEDEKESISEADIEAEIRAYRAEKHARENKI